MREVKTKSMIFVATVGDTRDVREFGGTPNSLISALQNISQQSSGINLAPFWMSKILKSLWRCWRLLTFRKPFGWQYSNLAHLGRKLLFYKKLTRQDVLVSFFQVVPDLHVKYVIYTDCSLRFLFSTHSQFNRIPLDIKENIIMREKSSYEKALAVYLKTPEALEDLQKNYGIPLEKLHLQLVPPNNFIDFSTKILEHRLALMKTEYRFLFIGKDGYRKGLDRAIDVIRILQNKGVLCRLDIVGTNEYKDLANGITRIHFHGKLDVGSDSLVGLLRDSHFGFLLTRAEAAGISLMEFQAAGIIPIVSDFQSAKSLIQVTNYFLLDHTEDLELLAERVYSYLLSSNLSSDLDLALKEARNLPTWEICAGNILTSLQE